MFWLLVHLRVAYATEIGAATAYRGHAGATRDPEVAAHIRTIEQDERHHRAAVGAMLTRLGARPFYLLDALYFCVGTVIGCGCYAWGEWASAFGAAQFELGGIGDYRRAARAARAIGDEALARQLESFEAQERAHRAFFLDLARSRFLARVLDRAPLVLADHRPASAVGESAPRYCGPQPS